MHPARIAGLGVAGVFGVLAFIGTTSLGLFIFYGVMIIVGLFIAWVGEQLA